MFEDVALQIALYLIIIAFVAEYFDSSIGMGYGTLLTPILLLTTDYTLKQIVPAVLCSELVTGFLAGITHHCFGNVDFTNRGVAKTDRASSVGWISRDLKVAALIGLCSVIGAVGSVVLALHLPPFWIKVYVGVLLLFLGVAVLAKRNSPPAFHWGRIVMLGMLASFNKGISGGGYGPVVTGGQLLGGVDARKAVGITSVAEALTCLVGVALYLSMGVGIEWSLAGPLMIGAVLSVPLSGWTVRRLTPKRLTLAVGAATTVLGMLTLVKLM